MSSDLASSPAARRVFNLSEQKRPAAGPRYHTATCLLWLVAALLAAMLTKNPFYLLLVLLAVGLTYQRLKEQWASHQAWGSFLKIGVVLVLFSLAFNLLFTNAGATVLFTLPEVRWETNSPTGEAAAFQLGGKVTLESLAFGLSAGLALLAMLVIFATFNVLVDYYQLLRYVPNFLYQSAIVMSIAITFIPQLMLAQREIREAQALRGHRFRRLRDLLPLFVTLLAEGLERSITLAESMEARGFARQTTTTARAVSTGLPGKGLVALALALLAGGVFAQRYFPNPLPGRLALFSGGLLLVGLLWFMGRTVRRSRYRRELWRRKDTLVALTSGLISLVLAATWLAARSAFIFYPYPRFSWPPFDPLIGLLLLLLAAPVAAGRLTGENGDD